MKPFASFVVFVVLLCVAVSALWVWKNPHEHGPGSWRRTFQALLHGTPTEQHRPEIYTVADGPRLNLKDVDVLAAMSRQRITLAKAVVPSVVSITTSRSVQVPNLPSDDPILQFFHRGLRSEPGHATQRALGSGAIVSKEGHIVTNNHVIDGMDQIEVELSDGRRKQARVIGTDSNTDIAVLKIDADNLTPLPFGDSDGVEVGETVMAVGNPYGLEESVTQGIISAKDRPSSEEVGDLFQIDAAINPGNSGGPLVNVRGELIGINEAIFSQSGGWQGVGFAIPSSTVRRTMDSILQTGRAIHGYLGVRQQPLTDELTRQRGVSDPPGVRVDEVVPGSPAANADIRVGDLIQKFGKKPIGDFQALRRSVFEVPVDTSVPIELSRDGRKVTVQAQIAERPLPDQLAQTQPGPRHPPSPNNRSTPPQGKGNGSNGSTNSGRLAPAGGSPLAPVHVTALAGATVRRLDIPSDVQGVVVGRIEAGSDAADKLQPGDIIERVDQQSVETPEEFDRVAQALSDSEPVVLSIMRERSRMLVVVNPA